MVIVGNVIYFFYYKFYEGEIVNIYLLIFFVFCISFIFLRKIIFYIGIFESFVWFGRFIFYGIDCRR